MKDFRSLEQKIRAMYEGKVPDNWEENSKSKRAATAKKVANDAMDHDKTDKILPHVPKVTEAVKDDDNDADNKPKAKKSDDDSDADNKSKSTDKDVGEIKGGKTEVDLKPTTDDKNENEDSEDKASKSAKNKANKDIGQKGVKEMHNPTKNFGLSDSLVEAARKVMSPVKEELKGGQKKLDKNHNGKLDGQDFKMLRKEEAEGIDEGNPVNKIKKNFAAISIGADAARKGDERFNKKIKTSVAAKMLGRQIQKEEAIDEVLDTPMKKLGYIAKNAYQVATADPAKMANDPKKANAIANRVIGAKRFQKKLNKEEVVAEGPTSPVVKSKDKYDVSDMVAKFKAKGGEVTKGKTAAAYGAKVPKRTKAMREDVELSADEMARIEAIIAEINL